nr:hypothetical protein [Salinigranum halophilum]
MLHLLVQRGALPSGLDPLVRREQPPGAGGLDYRSPVDALDWNTEFRDVELELRTSPEEVYRVNVSILGPLVKHRLPASVEEPFRIAVCADVPISERKPDAMTVGNLGRVNALRNHDDSLSVLGEAVGLFGGFIEIGGILHVGGNR